MIQYAGERKKTRRPAPTPGSWSARATTCASWEPASVSSGYIFQLERIYFSIRADIFFNQSGYIFQSERIYFSIYLILDFSLHKVMLFLVIPILFEVEKKADIKIFHWSSVLAQPLALVENRPPWGADILFRYIWYVWYQIYLVLDVLV